MATIIILAKCLNRRKSLKLYNRNTSEFFFKRGTTFFCNIILRFESEPYLISRYINYDGVVCGWGEGGVGVVWL